MQQLPECPKDCSLGQSGSSHGMGLRAHTIVHAKVSGIPWTETFEIGWHQVPLNGTLILIEAANASYAETAKVIVTL